MTNTLKSLRFQKVSGSEILSKNLILNERFCNQSQELKLLGIEKKVKIIKAQIERFKCHSGGIFVILRIKTEIPPE